MATLIPEDSIFGQLAEILGNKLIDTRFFLFDLWMIVHFSIGFFLSFIITDRELFGVQLQDWMIVLALLVIYELFEIFLRGILFEQEVIKNIIWDLVFGMAGFFIGKLIMHFFFN